MKHYDEEKIKLYKDNLLSEKESLEIEEHIYSCDRCLNEYLLLVEEDSLDLISEEIVYDFDVKVNLNQDEKKIEKDNLIVFDNKLKELEISDKYKKASIGKREKQLPKSFFIKYASVAAAVVLLTFSGKFTTSEIAKRSNDNLALKENIGVEENIVYQGSNLLASKLENILFRIENPNIRKISRLR